MFLARVSVEAGSPACRGGAEIVGRRSLASTRRPQILGAFETCVLRYGLEGSSLERIAQEAGVRRSLIRHYFGNRDELTKALIAGVIERTVSVYRDVIRTAGAEGGTAALVDYLMGPAFPDKRDDALIDALMAVSHRDEKLRGQLRAKYQTFQQSIHRELRRAFPSADPGMVRATSYSLMCLAVGNAAMYDLELPAREHGDARRCAMYLVACLQDTAPGR
jgi:AcrR family transcriptional regulator